jgi:hypothetical protein
MFQHPGAVLRKGPSKNNRIQKKKKCLLYDQGSHLTGVMYADAGCMLLHQPNIQQSHPRVRVNKHQPRPRSKIIVKVVPPLVSSHTTPVSITPVFIAPTFSMSGKPGLVATTSKNLPTSSDWLELHRPQTVKEVLGRKTQIDRLNNWLDEFKDNPTPPHAIALVHGRPGTGKTTVSRILLQKHGYKIVEVNASDTRTYDGITKVLDRVCLRMSITGKAALLLEEIDGTYESESGKSSITAIVDFLTKHKDDKNKTPIIATCNVTHKANIKQLYPYAKVISFPKLFDSNLRSLCQKIKRYHGINLSNQQTTDVITTAQGDARQVIQSLRILSLGNGKCGEGKDDGCNIFQVAKTILSGRLPGVTHDTFTDCGGYGFGLLFQNYTSIHNDFVEDCGREEMESQSLTMDNLSNYADTLGDCDLASTFHSLSFGGDLAIRGGVLLSKSVSTSNPVVISKCDSKYFARPNTSRSTLSSSYEDLCIKN